MPLRLVLLSDTHGLHREIGIPDGDVLVHAGDFCSEGEAVEARSFGEFFRGLPHRHKVVIAGTTTDVWRQTPVWVLRYSPVATISWTAAWRSRE